MKEKSTQTPVISVIMPTYNSAKTIERTLKSLREQTFDQELIEILVIDGGSADKTLEIAQKYNCRILTNKKKQAEYGKHIGLTQSKGRIGVFLDSDEVFMSNTALADRAALILQGEKTVMTDGYKQIKGSNIFNRYYTVFSDPFLYFMSGRTFEASRFLASLTKRHRRFTDFETHIVIHVKDGEEIPMFDFCAGSSLDLDFLRSLKGDLISDPHTVPILCEIYVKETKQIAVIKGSPIFHYSLDSMQNLRKKIIWRSIRNVHYIEEQPGFARKEEHLPLSLRLKKYLFIPYAATIVLPLFTAVSAAVRHKTVSALLIFPFTLYTAWAISKQLFFKIIGFKPPLISYQEKKEGSKEPIA